MGGRTPGIENFHGLRSDLPGMGAMLFNLGLFPLLALFPAGDIRGVIGLIEAGFGGFFKVVAHVVFFVAQTSRCFGILFNFRSLLHTALLRHGLRGFLCGFSIAQIIATYGLEIVLQFVN